MNGRRKVATILAGAALAAITTITSVGATGNNLLVNGDLKPNTNGWDTIGPVEFETIPTIGGRLSNTKVALESSLGLASQCVPVDYPHGSYNFSGSLRIPEDQLRSGGAYVRVTLHGGADCKTGSVQSVLSDRIDATTGWDTFSLDVERTNDTPAGSALVALLVAKDSTERLFKKGVPFEVQFKQLSFTAVSRGDENPDDGDGPIGCVMFGGGACPGDDDKPDDGGPAVACTDECPDDDDDDAPWDGPIGCEVGTEGCPGENPHEPAVPVLPDTKEEPAVDPFFPDFPQDDEPDNGSVDAPAAPTQDSDDGSDGSHDTPANPGSPSTPGVPSTGGNSGNNGSQDKPASQDGASQDGKPQDKPTLETQTPDTTVNVATPTPPPPATGGDNPNDPATDLSNGEGDSSEVARSEDGDGAQLPIIGGSLAALVALLGLGIVLKRASRN